MQERLKDPEWKDLIITILMSNLGVRGDITDSVQFDASVNYSATEWSNAWGDVLTDRFMASWYGENCRDFLLVNFEVGTDAALAAAGQETVTTTAQLELTELHLTLTTTILMHGISSGVA